MSRHTARRRARLAPLALVAVLGTSGIASVNPLTLTSANAAAGSTGSPAAAGAAASLTPVAAPQPGAPEFYQFDPRTPQRVLPGVKLKEKPPPWVLPVAGYHLTGRFGNVGLWASSHTGLDFAAPEGSEIRAIAPGTVTEVGYDGAFGNKTVVRLDDGTVLWFCHQSGTEVAPGDRVAPGQTIGYVGSTGNVTGPHLHLEVHPGGGDQAVDPESWLTEHELAP